MKIIVTCEHGGNKIPKKYLPLFKNKQKILKSHRGWDIGALILAKKMSHDLSAPLYYSTTSRLLIDLNRSLHHPALFSEFSKTANKNLKQHLISSIYIPYRSEVENRIKMFRSSRNTTIHLSIHSFTYKLNNINRTADIGLLYDPTRNAEKLFCKRLKASLEQTLPNLVVRSNYPYRGNADGFTSYLRNHFNEKDYIGIEIEINQKHSTHNSPAWHMIKKTFSKLILDIDI